MKVAIKGNLMDGIFIERINRFIAHVMINEKIENVHVANTGRMKELLLKGAKVIVRKVDKPNRKTKFDLVMVYKNNTLVMIDSALPNIILDRAFREKKLRGFKNDYDNIRREVTYGNSRFDLAVSNKYETVLVEAKCATLVKENGVATFPDAPTLRGRKHIYELIDSKKNGFRAAVFFIILRNDAIVFKPNYDMDMEFGLAVKEGFNNGVEFYAYICEVNRKMISLLKEIPVEI